MVPGFLDEDVCWTLLAECRTTQLSDSIDAAGPLLHLDLLHLVALLHEAQHPNEIQLG